MNGAQHYREAEQLARRANPDEPYADAEVCTVYAAIAQVHATLALVAATMAIESSDASAGGGFRGLFNGVAE